MTYLTAIREFTFSALIQLCDYIGAQSDVADALYEKRRDIVNKWRAQLDTWDRCISDMADISIGAQPAAECLPPDHLEHIRVRTLPTFFRPIIFHHKSVAETCTCRLAHLRFKIALATKCILRMRKEHPFRRVLKQYRRQYSYVEDFWSDFDVVIKHK